MLLPPGRSARAALLGCCLQLACLAQGPARPRLAVDADHFDFGRVAPDARLEHPFQLRNAGTAPLVIERVTSGCGCTSTLVGKQTLDPGETTELAVTFNTAGLRGRAQKSVEIVTNDPDAPRRTLTFEAEAAGAVDPEAEKVSFHDLAPTDRRKRSVKFTSRTGRPIQVQNAELSEAAWLGVATREEGSLLWVDLDLAAHLLPPGKLSGTDTVTLHVLNPWPSVVRLEVSWDQLPPVIAAPARVAWAEPPGRELSASVALRGRTRKPFRILGTRTTSPLLQVLEVSPRAAARQEVRLQWSASAPAGVYHEAAFLTLDTPGHPELEIRVEAALRKPAAD